MKRKKSNSSTPPISFSFGRESCTAISCALLFLLNLRDFPFEEKKIDKNCIDIAEEKMRNIEPRLTKGQAGATARAIIAVLELADGGFDKYTYVEEDFPGLLSRLESSLPVLRLAGSEVQRKVLSMKNK